jgi:serine/threonine protein kinase
MSKSVDKLLVDGLEYLHFLELEKNKLKASISRGPRQLCATAHESFYFYFNELQVDKIKLREIVTSFPGFSVSLEVAVELLGEIKKFVAVYSGQTQGASTLKLASKAGHRVGALAEFNHRLKDALKVLGLQVKIDPEEKWGFEEVTEYVAVMVEDMLKDHRDESKETQAQLLDLLKQYLAETVKGVSSTTVNSLVESVTNSRDGVSLESIYVYDPMPKHYRDKGHILGRGAFATTVRVKSTQDNQFYAMKELEVKDVEGAGLELSKVHHEVRMLLYINHDHIVRYFVSFLSDDKTRFNMVMELADGGNLASKVSCDPQPPLLLIKKWIIQCLSALYYMHEKRMWHRDIKPENILLTLAGDIKIADLGLACIEKSSMSKPSVAGTTTYASYEKAHGLPFDSKDDIWGLGCVFVELITRKRLQTWGGAFYELSNMEVVRRKQMILEACQTNTTSDPVVYNAIEMALEADPVSRWSACQLQDLFQPPSELLKQLSAAQETINVMNNQLSEAKELLDLRDREVLKLETKLADSQHQCALNENRAKEAQEKYDGERKLRFEVEARLKAEESKNVALQKKCKDAEDRVFAEKTRLRGSLEEQAKLDKALEDANAQQRLLEEQLEMQTSKFEALRSNIKTLEKENKQLQHALAAAEEKQKREGIQLKSGKNTISTKVYCQPCQIKVFSYIL